jgi:hypothetical protein
MTGNNELLERRITDVINEPGRFEAAEIGDIITEAEATAATLSERITSLRAKASDLIGMSSEDARAAVLEADLADLQKSRLSGVMAPLRATYTAALERARCERHRADISRVAQRRDEAAERFRRYEALANEIADILAMVVEVDREVQRVNLNTPDSMSMTPRLKPVELEARGLERFTRDCPALATEVVLPDWNGGGNLWPLRSANTLASAYVASMPELRPNQFAYTPDWWRADPKQAAAAGVSSDPALAESLARERQRVDKFYQSQVEDSEKMFKEAERARFEASRRAN